MKKPLTPILSSLLLLALAGCATTVLETEYVAQSEVQKVKRSGRGFVEVSGLAMHSSMGVEDVDVQREGDDIFILVKMVPMRKGLSGNYSAMIPITSGKERIYFGENKKQIWGAK